MAQWWENSPPTNVARVQIPASTPCGLSLLLVFFFAPSEVLPGHSGFSPLLKTQHFQIPIRPGKIDDERLCECATSKIVIYSFIYLVTHLGVALSPLKRVGTWDQATPGRSG